jgi:membrane associated rhomboid family serine protease
LAEVLWVHWFAASLVPEVAEAGPLGLTIAVRKMHLALNPPEVMAGALWQLVTYMLVHDPISPFHAILNILFTWMFGAEFEMRWGTKRFVRFYILCGALAGVFVVAWSAVIPGEWDRVTLGASGAVYALIAAYAVIFPHRKMWPIPIKVKTFVWVLVGLTVLYFLVRSDASFGAHMGGLIAGYLVTSGDWRPRRWADRIRLWQHKRRRASIRVVQGGDDEPPKTNGRTLH